MTLLQKTMPDFDEFFPSGEWYEGIDYVPQPDTRTDEEIAAEQVQDELNHEHSQA